MMRGRITKKKAAAAFCLCMFCFLLAGCSGDKGGVAINDGSGNLTDDESQPYEIDYWIAVEAAGIPKDLSLVEAEINRIVTKKINATVKLHPVLVGDYENRMQLVVNAGDKFDLCFTSPWMNNYAKNVRLEGFWDITDLLPEYAPKTWALYDERIWSAARVEGRIYGSINRQIMARTPGVTLDRAMYEASGMTQEDFKTLDGFTEFLAYCYNNGADRANITQGYDPQGLIAFFGFDDINGASCPGVVDVSADKPAVINQFESEKFRNALKYSVDWYKKGYIPADALTAAFDFSKSYGLLSSTWKPSQEGEDTLRRKGRASICFPIGPSYM
ncbi:MAG: hypothetical protein LBO81_04925 [Clostridiales Family XIII bacterium]|jgi:putative aldouronate transport system substrate-binding protein|nr:hypothetical protein [Clostridiales Family XIII bacterium]